jgi:hypothetical protein
MGSETKELPSAGFILWDYATKITPMFRSGLGKNLGLIFYLIISITYIETPSLAHSLLQK